MDEDVRSAEQSAQRCPVVRIGHVQLDTALGPVPALAGQFMGEIGAATRLDLQHIGAMVGEQHARNRDRHFGRQLDNDKMVQRAGHHALLFGGLRRLLFGSGR